jgi:nitroreductase
LDATQAVRTKLDVREFSPEPVPAGVKYAVLEAGRLTQSGVNSQHWRFILVQNRPNLERLARDSNSGRWVSGANFAVVICTDPSKGYHLIDAGRAAQDMQLTAWDHGVASGLYTGIDQAATRRDFGIPGTLNATVVLGFGFPGRKLRGKKNRRRLSDIAFLEKYGGSLEPLAGSGAGDNNMGDKSPGHSA